MEILSVEVCACEACGAEKKLDRNGIDYPTQDKRYKRTKNILLVGRAVCYQTILSRFKPLNYYRTAWISLRSILDQIGHAIADFCFKQLFNIVSSFSTDQLSSASRLSDVSAYPSRENMNSFPLPLGTPRRQPRETQNFRERVSPPAPIYRLLMR